VSSDCQHSGGFGGSEARILRRGRKFSLELLTGKSREGREIHWEVIRHPGAAVILPLLDETAEGRQGRSPKVVMIRNRRPAVGQTLWELPAGTLEPPEPPETCAARELEEETGYRAATIPALGRFYTTPGMTDELMWAFIATELTPVGQRLEADEDVTVEALAPERVLGMIDAGEIMDGKTIASILLAQRRGLIGAG
jgi:ADP-ribose pyrophosphatase